MERNVFEAVRGRVTAREAADAYGLAVNRAGMAVCPFHPDKNPSLKVDRRYYCFGCGARGDAVDLTAHLLGIGGRSAAQLLCRDFGISTEAPAAPIRPRRAPWSSRAKDTLVQYRKAMADRLEAYAPADPEAPWDDRFCDALTRRSRADVLLGEWLDRGREDAAGLEEEYGKEIEGYERELRDAGLV